MHCREWESVAAAHGLTPPHSGRGWQQRPQHTATVHTRAPCHPQRPESDRRLVGRCWPEPPDAPEPPAVPQNFLAYLFRVGFPKQPAEPAALARGRPTRPGTHGRRQPGPHLPLSFLPLLWYIERT